MKTLLKDKLKNIPVKRWLYLFFLAVLIFVLFLITTGFVLKKYQEKAKKEALERFEREMERPYMEDKYGGKTPEETFDMFLEALKNEDIELASKYFILEKQIEQKSYFKKVKEIGRFEEMINDLNNGIIYKGKLYEDNKQYEIKNKEGKVIFGGINFARYPNNLWKLVDL